MSIVTLILAYAVAATAAITVLAIWPYRKLAVKAGLVATPNERSAHVSPTVSGAGLVFVLASFLMYSMCVLLGIVSFALIQPLWVGAIGAAIIGFLDDRHPIKPAWRAVVHLGLGLLFALSLPGPPWLLVPMLVLTVAWSLNLFNFMDGSDGLAASEAVLVLGIGGWFCWYSGAQHLAIIAWIVVGGCCGFLFWNWPKARVFMGDVGSGFLGYLIAAIALYSVLYYGVPALSWLILYGYFCFDTGATLLRRLWRGEKWYLSHKSHAYQRLMHIGGLTHLQLLLRVLALNFLLAALAVWSFLQPNFAVWAAAIAIAILMAAYLYVERHCPMVKSP